MSFTKDQARQKLIEVGVQEENIEDILSENFPRGDEEILWISGISPMIQNWYDNTVDYFPLRHSIHKTDTKKTMVDYYVVTERKWNQLKKQINANVASEVLRELPKKEITMGFQTIEEFQNAMQSLGVWDEYEKRCRMREEGNKLIQKATIKINFGKYTSWETGLSFWILSERVSEEVFSALRKCGIWNHNTIDEENEERFTGWCFSGRDIEKIQIQLAEHNIQMI